MIEELEKIFKIKINNQNLFKKALTHPSYTTENNLSYFENYERLEFFGDAVLKLAVSKKLLIKYKDLHEGDLTKIRAILVSDATLFKIVEKLGINKLIIMGKNADKTGGRKLQSINACTFEALLGAFYLDGSEKEIYEFLDNVFEENITDVKEHFAVYNAKEVLQEYTQAQDGTQPVYKLIETKGPDHAPVFVMNVIFQNRILATAEGKSKKAAEQKCAYEACVKLGVINE
jgi:ribonuclease-3